ncbi:hypothetical protein DRP05_12320 [Archaeoglobales archaeon]|nr:MAG: hypothetical protein DRP05_12320 [Archaeoglobales archaeon]
MIETVFFGLFLLLAILSSGFFLWIGLRLIGKQKGIFEVGLANLAAGIFAFIVLIIIAVIPLIGIVSPIVSYFAYLYALKTVLDISMLEAFAVSIISSLVFFLTAILISAFLGIWLLKYAMIKPVLKPELMHF